MHAQGSYFRPRLRTWYVVRGCKHMSTDISFS